MATFIIIRAGEELVVDYGKEYPSEWSRIRKLYKNRTK